MGATSAIFYEEMNPGTINCMALDSGFSSMMKIVNSVAG